MWRTGRATLDEIETRWSICDVWLANAVLDLEEDREAEAALQMPTPPGKR